MDITDLSLPPNRELYVFRQEKPNYPVFIPGFLTATIFFCLAMVFAASYSRFGFVAFLVATALTSIPVAAEFFKNQLRGVSLTRDHLEIARGYQPETARISLENIVRVEVVEFKTKQADQYEHRTILFDKETNKFGPNAKCVIHTNGGQKIHLSAKYFPKGDFGQFLTMLETARAAYQQSLAQNPYHNLSATSAVVDQINQVAKSNYTLLQEDRQLGLAIEESMIEAYRTLYTVRDSFDLDRITGRKAIYQFKQESGKSAFILAQDFLPDLDEETKEIGQNLIDAAQKNLALVTTRVEYYQKIDRELDKLRTREVSRRKLQTVADKLRDLQEKNTNKSIEQSLTGDLTAEQPSVQELEELSQRVAGLSDLEQSQILKEYISLFDKP